MADEEVYGAAAAEFALQDLPKSDVEALIAHALKVGISIECLDHVPPPLEESFTKYRKRYSFWLSGGSDGVEAVQANTTGLFGLSK